MKMKLNKSKLINILVFVLFALIIFIIVYFFVLDKQAGDCLQNPMSYFFQETFKGDYMCSCSYDGGSYIYTNEIVQQLEVS